MSIMLKTMWNDTNLISTKEITDSMQTTSHSNVVRISHLSSENELDCDTDTDCKDTIILKVMRSRKK